MFDSPTTPGLKIDFRNYVIELVCLNTRHHLPPRFWKQPYWAKKYARECRGFAKFVKLHEDQICNPAYQQAVIDAIRSINCKSLLIESTLEKLDKAIEKAYENLLEMVSTQSQQPKQIEDINRYMKDNSMIVVDGVDENSKFNKLRKIEKDVEQK